MGPGRLLPVLAACAALAGCAHAVTRMGPASVDHLGITTFLDDVDCDGTLDIVSNVGAYAPGVKDTIDFAGHLDAVLSRPLPANATRVTADNWSFDVSAGQSGPECVQWIISGRELDAGTTYHLAAHARIDGGPTLDAGADVQYGKPNLGGRIKAC